ncbi:PTS-dependent dihydroxyacetone kinase phosphotransferase subunit DhaM [Williamsoniiplasma lucivorax]|uniref:Dihydroxyacetone kinase phosphotransfer subunit n=1 Tax=Williamsoniiplasma lucivorax TaxID=209274 RepID=A0A2S5RD68_9MOLU|nr:hypothetical protein [Williamsoniiplasma lucivorax]PPE05271.1 dihydroxyacetone kinase phosphotransfer subunit [Williamsoniiplasma lucivorax]
MVDILVVSHSENLAKAAIEFLSEMKYENFQLDYCAGIIDGDQKAFGSDPMLIAAKIEKIYTKNDILIICDIGSSYMNSEMALSFLINEISPHVLIHHGPFFESLLIGIVSNDEKMTAQQLSEKISFDLKETN